jgi:hypothetical protein
VTIKTRDKAQDVFNQGNYFFAQKVGFSQAFPEITNLKVEVNESGDGVSRFSGGLAIYDQNLVGEFINCSNPLCYNGGIRIGFKLGEMVRKKETQGQFSGSCQGYEGSPKGTKKYRDCCNYFQVKIFIKYKEPASEQS